MRLEIASFPVRHAALGTATRYVDGALTIGHDTVRALILRDPRIGDVRLEIVQPGDRVRVLRALDAVEPLHKVDGPSTAFPGFNGPPNTCGAGRTHRLDGFTVVQVAAFPFPASGVQAFEEGVLEMSGPGAAWCGCADRVNLLLVLRPGAVSSNQDYDDAVRRAALRAADALAAATRDLTPGRLETFELHPPAPGLPRVVWVHQVRAQGPMVQTFLYGHEMSGMAPTVLHPNELLDGALVSGNYKAGSRTSSFRHARHPALATLYARHGHDVSFAGVIVARGHHENELLKQRSAHVVAKLAGELGAQGALCTYEGTGNTHIDFMLTVQALERAGISTGSVVHEYGGPQGQDAPLVDFVPEAVALASSGGIDRRVSLPAVDRVIGGTHLAHRATAGTGAVDLPIQELYAVTVEMDARGFTALEH